MKTSPFKVTAGGVEKPQEKPRSPYDGFYVGPSNIEDAKDTDPGFTIKITEEEKEKMEKTDPGFSIGPETAVGEDIAEYLTPGSIGEALLMMFPFGGVAGKSKAIQNIVKKVPGLSKLFKSGKTMTKNQKFDFQKGFSDGLQARGGVSSSSKGEFMVGGNKVKFDTSHKNLNYDIKGGINAAEDITKVTNAKGVDLDNFVSKLDGPTDYSKSITKLPSKGTRDFVKVDLPNGESQIFYKSSGAGGKAGSKGEWIPFEGHRKSDGWYIKTGSRGKFHGKNVETIFTYKDGAGNVISKSDWVKRGSNQNLVESTGVYEQVKKLGLDPWKEIQKGNLKLDHYGQGFKYGGKEYVKIAEQLKKMNL